MAVHAGLGRRNAGKGRALHGRVAIAAIDPQDAHVVLMTEGHVLDDAHAHASPVGRTLIGKPRPEGRHYAPTPPTTLALAITFDLAENTCGTAELLRAYWASLLSNLGRSLKSLARLASGSIRKRRRMGNGKPRGHGQDSYYH